MLGDYQYRYDITVVSIELHYWTREVSYRYNWPCRAREVDSGEGHLRSDDCPL